MSGRTVLLLAGEASGDEYGAGLAAALARRRTDLRFVGTGGPRMEAEGVELLAGLGDLGVMGLAEVLPRIPFFRRLERELRDRLSRADVALVVLVDHPGLNLRIAEAAHRRGVPVLYYVAPKVWAWRLGRVRVLARAADRVASILPFEEDFLTERGVSVTYVGHPLLDRPDAVPDRVAFCERWGLDPARPLLAVLPGSRPQEIRRHLDVFVRAAERVVEARPEVVPVISRAAGLSSEPFRHLSPVVLGEARPLLGHASAALVKSGTGTLEAALAGTPLVVAYRTSALTWAVARRLLRVEHVSLPNLVAGARIVPEYLQRDATPVALARALAPLIDSESPERREQVAGLRRVREALGGAGATERVADLALGLMEAGA